MQPHHLDSTVSYRLQPDSEDLLTVTTCLLKEGQEQEQDQEQEVVATRVFRREAGVKGQSLSARRRHSVV